MVPLHLQPLEILTNLDRHLTRLVKKVFGNPALDNLSTTVTNRSHMTSDNVLVDNILKALVLLPSPVGVADLRCRPGELIGRRRGTGGLLRLRLTGPGQILEHGLVVARQHLLEATCKRDPRFILLLARLESSSNLASDIVHPPLCSFLTWHRFGPEEVVLERGVGVRPPGGVKQEELVEEVAGALGGYSLMMSTSGIKSKVVALWSPDCVERGFQKYMDFGRHLK